jgi:hypothetical protein
MSTLYLGNSALDIDGGALRMKLLILLSVKADFARRVEPTVPVVAPPKNADMVEPGIVV